MKELAGAKETEPFSFKSDIPIYKDVLRAAAKTEEAVCALRGWAANRIPKLTKSETKAAKQSLSKLQADIRNQISK